MEASDWLRTQVNVAITARRSLLTPSADPAHVLGSGLQSSGSSVRVNSNTEAMSDFNGDFDLFEPWAKH